MKINGHHEIQMQLPGTESRDLPDKVLDDYGVRYREAKNAMSIWSRVMEQCQESLVREMSLRKRHRYVNPDLNLKLVLGGKSYVDVGYSWQGE